MRYAMLPLSGVCFLLLLLILMGAAAASPVAAVGVVALGVVGVYALVRYTPKPEGAEAPPLRLTEPQYDPTAATIPDALASMATALPPGLLLPALLGDVGGERRWIDVATAPHVLVGGSTGSGKSVFLSTLIATATASMSPQRLGLIVIDPKRVEFRRFARLPHCIGHATTKRDALRVLSALADEMDGRYISLDRACVKDVGDAMPRRLVVIDEFADLTIPHDKTKAERDLSDDINAILARLLALGRAAGYHVVLATQSPRREVVTGLIKGNAPMRVAFRASNGIESRIILDAKGAEALPGRGAGLIVSPQVPNAAKPGEPVPFQSVMVPEAVLRAYCGE